MPVLTDLTIKSDSFLTNSDFTKDRTTVRKLWTADSVYDEPKQHINFDFLDFHLYL